MRYGRRLRYHRNTRRSGQFDVADLVVGIGLVVVVAALVYFVGGSFVEDHYVAPMGQKPEVDAPPDREEVRMHLAEATNLVETNARHFLKMMEETTDGNLQDKYRQWADMALEEGLSKLNEVKDFLIKKHPDGDAVFRVELRQVEALRREARARLAQVRKLDILGGR